MKRLLNLRAVRSRRSLVASLAALCAVAIAATAYGATTYINGVTLTGGGTTEWWPYTRSACTYASSDPVFSPAGYGYTTSNSHQAFSGGFVVWVGGINGKPFGVESGKGDLVGKKLTVGPAKVGPLKVSETETALDTSPTLRMLLKLTNTKAKTLARVISVETQLTSSQPNVYASSTGDRQWTKKDRWIVTADAKSNPSTAPATQVWFGKGAQVGARSADHTRGYPYCFLSNFSVRLPPRSTRYLMFFAEMSDKSVANAVKSARKFNSRDLSKSLLRGLRKGLLRKIINWDL